MPECRFKDDADKAQRLMEFLQEHGDDLPFTAIIQAITDDNLENWVTECDENNNIISGITWDNNDWYLCTFHYLATDPEHRGKGLGTKVTAEAVKSAKKNPNCLVLAADITQTNEPSKRIFEKLGFKEKTRFCWGEGEEPADILHYIDFPPDGEACKQRPKD